jgi:cytidyltransferase-like protein
VSRWVVLSGAFDDLRSAHVRLLQEAARLGPVRVLLWPDAQVLARAGRPPKFPQEERRYLLEALRWVREVVVPASPFDPDTLPPAEPAEGLSEEPPALWAVGEAEDSPARRTFAEIHGLEYRVIRDAELRGFPAGAAASEAAAIPSRPKVLVTGCYDWFHSGHVCFFEEASALGELYVVIGHDANVRLLKGEGHPLFPQEERRYLVASVRHVHRALISSGQGWLDAEPEIRALRPDLHVVNEDGDKPEKRAYCAARGIRYVVLQRVPREGLPRRQSTDLRGY